MEVQAAEFLLQFRPADIIDQDRLFAPSGPRGNFHSAFLKPQFFGQQFNAGVVGCPFHRRRGDLHFQKTFGNAGD